MDRDNSPSPSPRRISSLDNSSFTSPPFTSTLPLPNPLTRPTSDSRLYTRKVSSKRVDYPSSPPHRPQHTRSVTASMASRSPSPSPARKPATNNDKSFDMDDYTIDLANLGQSSAGGRDLFAAIGGSDAETPVRERDVVPSEDDGPEDFTVNMGKWMKGDGHWRNGISENRANEPFEEQQEEIEDEPQGDGEVFEGERAAEEPILESEEPDYDRRRGRPASVEDLREDEEGGSVVMHAPAPPDEHEAVAHDQSTTPPKTPNQAKASHNQVAEEVFNSISILQAEVERLRLEAEHYRKEISALDSERAQSEAESEELMAELRDAKSSIEQLNKRNADQQDRWDLENNKPKSPMSNVGSLRAKFEPLARELEVARQEIEAVRNESNVKVTALVEQLCATQDELVESRKAEKQSSANAADLSGLRADLAHCKQDLINQQKAYKIQEETLQTENQDLQSRLTAAEKVTFDTKFLRTELKDTQEELAHTRILLQKAEEDNKHLSEQHLRHIDELDDLKDERNEAHRVASEREEEIKERDAQIDNLKKELELEKHFYQQDLAALKMEVGQQAGQQNADALLESTDDDDDDDDDDDGRDSDNATGPLPEPPQAVDSAEQDMRLADQLDTLSTHYEAELASLKKSHEAEIKKMKSVILRAAEGMRKREAWTSRSHAEETDSLRRTIAGLKQARAQDAVGTTTAQPSRAGSETASKDGHNVAELRAAVRVLSSKLKTATDELRQAQDHVCELTLQGDDQRREQEERTKDREAVDQALEERFAEVCEKREREWRRRMRLVLRDREMMGRALLWGWGKEEVGERETEGQKGMGYQYRFAKA